MLELEVIETAAAASLALDPIKSQLLAQLAHPASAATLAARLGLSRQKVNYHLRQLEEEQLVEPAEERRWGGLVERVMVASAASYVISPAALGPVAADPARAGDRLSAAYLIAMASRIVREVGQLWRLARKKERRLATLTLDREVRFLTPADRASFNAGLAEALSSLIARYHDEAGRPHRVIVGAYPVPEEG